MKNERVRTKREWESILLGVPYGYIPEEGKQAVYEQGHTRMAALQKLGVWKDGDRILDIGSGNGRLAIPLVNQKIHYVGFEIIPGSIVFCRKAFKPWRDRFNFRYADVFNAFYNPKGTLDPAIFRFDYPDKSFDCILCSSLFTHLGTPEVCRHYINEVQRLLRRGGMAYVTWFRSPPNKVHYKADRTVFREKDILSLLKDFDIKHAEGGLTQKWRDQWRMVLRRRWESGKNHST